MTNINQNDLWLFRVHYTNAIFSRGMGKSHILECIYAYIYHSQEYEVLYNEKI